MTTSTSSATSTLDISSKKKTKIAGTTTKLGDDGLPTTTMSFSVDKSKDYTFKLTNPNSNLVVLNDKNQIVATVKTGTDPADATTRLAPGEYHAVMTQNNADQFGSDYELLISEKVSTPVLSNNSMTKLEGQTSALGDSGFPSATRSFSVDKAKDYNFQLINPQMTMTVYNERGQVVVQASSSSEAADVSAKLGPGNYHAVLSQKYQNSMDKDYQLNISERASAVVTSSGGALTGTAYPAASANDSCVQRSSLKVVQEGNYSADLSMPNTSWTIQDKDGKVVASGNSQEANQVTDYLKKSSFKLGMGDYSVVLVLPTTLTENKPWNFNLTGRPEGLDSVSTSSSDALPGSESIKKSTAERQARLKQWAAESSSSSSNTTA